MYSSKFIFISTLVLFSLISVSLAGKQSGFAYLKYFNTKNCSNDSEYGGLFVKAGSCIGKTVYDCSGDPNKIGIQKFKDNDCSIPIEKKVYHRIDQCLEHVINHEYYGYSASCVDSLVLPQQSTVNFAYTGYCESPNWKEHIISATYSLLDTCVLLTHGSAKYRCTPNQLTTTSYTAYNNDCRGEPQKIVTIPYSVYNFCSDINQVNICFND
ncbi:hypothetical protein PPL_11565 [Heterostelium album PN500]|uniref:Uncharacterized protein n=1 Tax=Heterostelium pallidum (strain ATCC 26659 / Pp 5 / PN500) TaxID=670386 RepID=D3BVH4_HETP5|nr:hypothetical protein PPL_11565 [Heterostelium album PN500]EFA74597.1 hypothetical protein PPL_11565 [Heterostelium album PN500]|eukprot:XP_020426731.1 hypothetical protein PPL_11565 [Heterostelium album PN500]